jgi:hypothetical protein
MSPAVTDPNKLSVPANINDDEFDDDDNDDDCDDDDYEDDCDGYVYLINITTWQWFTKSTSIRNQPERHKYKMKLIRMIDK